MQVFGLTEGNARAFWNWEFLGEMADLPQTRAMLMRACDVRLPTRLGTLELDQIATALIAAAAAVKEPDTSEFSSAAAPSSSHPTATKTVRA